MKRFFLFLTTLCLAGILTGSTLHAGILPTELPKVFILGDHESDYNTLVESYPQSLLEASDSDMERAYERWTGMLHEFERFAQKKNVNIDGVKVWMHVFWNADGSIDHIGYYLHPMSRSIETELLSELLTEFARQYTLPLVAQEGYAHYSMAEFPVFGKLKRN